VVDDPEHDYNLAAFIRVDDDVASPTKPLEHAVHVGALAVLADR